jgi:hypothetical protein
MEEVESRFDQINLKMQSGKWLWVMVVVVVVVGDPLLLLR